MGSLCPVTALWRKKWSGLESLGSWECHAYKLKQNNKTSVRVRDGLREILVSIFDLLFFEHLLRLMPPQVEDAITVNDFDQSKERNNI